MTTGTNIVQRTIETLRTQRDRSGVINLEDIELRLRALARLERIRGKNGSANANGVPNTSGRVVGGFGGVSTCGASVGED